ncbi:MAG: flavohemoglobin expression-modulating QEGLA motif protein [Calditrichaeota bacterium]|nr:MAG: flavohemoglobin expression-modulating QEGLA motif protein [Calditrichota bacterium]
MKIETKTVSDRFIKTVCQRLANNKQVRRSLPKWGRVHIDRQLPFLCVYRRQNLNDDSLSERLIMGEASYLTATRNRSFQRQLANLVKNIAQTQKENFGSFLVVEVWFTTEGTNNESPFSKPAFKIISTPKSAILSTVDTFEKALKRIKIRKEAAEVKIVTASKIAPKGMPPLLTPAEARQLGCHIIGIEVRQIIKNPETGEIFPLIRRELQRQFSRALKTYFFEFTNKLTAFRPQHYLALGRWSMVKAVWEVDKQLAEISNHFDFLLQVTPINSTAAWSSFQRNHFEKTPAFVYRPLPLDPVMTKRLLFHIPIERIEDPTIAQLFREQQLELDRKLTLLIDRGTQRFLFGSLQLYGAVKAPLLNLANELLEKLPPRSRDESSGKSVDAKTFAALAMQELSTFHNILPESQNKVMVRDDINGLMVSQGNLLIGARTKIPETRIEALIQHEVGTHVLTYINGKTQPFRQLYIGLAGYDELQEGLAVLAEYLVGGLTRPRMRLLAARVVAAHALTNGASFVDVFRELNKTYGFERRTAFTITVRTFRSGGLTKDAVYLRGLVQLLDYLKNGGELEPLLIGKISANHISIIKELQWRKVLHPAPLIPRYLCNPQSLNKLNGLRNGLTIINLVKRSKK